MVKDQTPAADAAPVAPLDETADLLHSAALRLLRLARTADVRMDLDGPRASALSVVVYGGPLPLTRLAAAEQVSPPAMTKTVAALERAGLVRRDRDDTDRRVVLVTATDAGRDLLTRGRAERVRLIADLLDHLPERDRHTLRRAATVLLDKVIKAPKPGLGTRR
jgi:DNA-binding MarR family transcriptional regulator